MLPTFIPTFCRTSRDTLCSRLFDKNSVSKLGGKEGEEDGFLIQRLHFRCLYLLCPFYQLIRLCHMEDEFVADEFGGSVVEVGTNNLTPTLSTREGGSGIQFRANGRRHRGHGRCEGLSVYTLRRGRTNHAKRRKYHRYPLDVDSHTEDDGVEVFAEHADEGRIGGLEVMTETGTLVGREAELAGFGEEQFLIEMIELFGCCFDDIAGVLRGLYILAVKGLVFIDDEGEQAREVTVFDRRHEGMVLAEGTGDGHGR